MKKMIPLSLLILTLASLSAYSQGKKSFEGTIFDLKTRPGFINITELNGGIGLYMIDRDFSKSLFNLTTIGGIGIAKNLTIGVGVGVSFYNGGTLEPLFADIRYFFKIKKTRFFVFGEGGVLLNSGKTETGRKYILSPGAGVLLPVSDHLSISLGAALLSQLMKVNDHDSFAVAKGGITYFFNKGKK